MQQLTLDFTEMMPVIPFKKQPRPEHKPYEPNTANLEDYFILQGAFLDWTRTFGAFTHFLKQESPDPKLQKARDWKWEGKVVKLPAYRWREFESGWEPYASWIGLFNKHLLGYTTNHFKNHRHERDFITRRIEDGFTAFNGFIDAFFETLRHFGITGRDAERYWTAIERQEKLQTC